MGRQIVKLGKYGLLDYPDITYLPTFSQENDGRYEYPALEIIQSLPSDCRVLYLHTKGVTRIENTQMDDWRNLMEYYCVERWSDAIWALNQGYDTYGVNWHSSPFGHYSGNFWWASTDYIKRLPSLPVGGTREYCEQWIGEIEGNHYCPHDSEIDHYKEIYPRELYAENSPDYRYV